MQRLWASYLDLFKNLNERRDHDELLKRRVAGLLDNVVDSTSGLTDLLRDVETASEHSIRVDKFEQIAGTVRMMIALVLACESLNIDIDPERLRIMANFMDHYERALGPLFARLYLARAARHLLVAKRTQHRWETVCQSLSEIAPAALEVQRLDPDGFRRLRLQCDPENVAVDNFQDMILAADINAADDDVLQPDAVYERQFNDTSSDVRKYFDDNAYHARQSEHYTRFNQMQSAISRMHSTAM